MDKGQQKRCKQVLKRLRDEMPMAEILKIIKSPVIDEKLHFHSKEEAVGKLGKNGEMEAVLYIRVSTDAQKKNVEARINDIIEDYKKAGIKIIKVFAEVAPGWSNCLGERKKLPQAVCLAKEKGVSIAVTSVDRMIRSVTGGKYDPLREWDIVELQKITGNVPIISLIPPGTPMKKVTGYLTRLGHKGKGNKGGRPRNKYPGYKNDIREAHRDEVIQLHWEDVSYRKIAKMIFEKYKIKISKSTIHKWMNDMEK